MGIVSTTTFTSDTETVTRIKLNGLVANLLTEFNGNIDNNNIKSSAAIAYSKLNLTGAILNADLAGSIAYAKLSLTGAILNADLAGSIAYSKLVLTGAVLNADLAGSIADSKLSQITTTAKVSGAALTLLTSVPAGAGILPIANIASGTPDGTKFVRDDGSLQAINVSYSSVAGAYIAGDYPLNLIPIGPVGLSNQVNSGTYTKVAEMYIPRSGALRVKFWLVRVGGSTSGKGQIYRNGAAVGTEQTETAGTGSEYSEDISGWSAGDLLQLYVKNGGDGASLGGGVRVYTSVPVSEVGNFSTYPFPRNYFGTNTIPTGFGTIGDFYMTSGGGASTTLYVKTGASTWTAK